MFHPCSAHFLTISISLAPFRGVKNSQGPRVVKPLNDQFLILHIITHAAHTPLALQQVFFPRSWANFPWFRWLLRGGLPSFSHIFPLSRRVKHNFPSRVGGKVDTSWVGGCHFGTTKNCIERKWTEQNKKKTFRTRVEQCLCTDIRGLFCCCCCLGKVKIGNGAMTRAICADGDGKESSFFFLGQSGPLSDGGEIMLLGESNFCG